MTDRTSHTPCAEIKEEKTMWNISELKFCHIFIVYSLYCGRSEEVIIASEIFCLSDQ